MKKWQKATIWTVIGVFLYLGTGYQFAKTSWEIFHSGKDYRELLEEKNDLHFLLYKALWPVASAWVADTNDPLSKNPQPPVLVHSKKQYLIETTFFWGLKIIFNLFLVTLLGLFDAAALLVLTIYSLIKFLIVLFASPFSG